MLPQFKGGKFKSNVRYPIVQRGKEAEQKVLYAAYHIKKQQKTYVCRIKYWKTVVCGNKNPRTWFTLLSMQK